MIRVATISLLLVTLFSSTLNAEIILDDFDAGTTEAGVTRTITVEDVLFGVVTGSYVFTSPTAFPPPGTDIKATFEYEFSGSDITRFLVPVFSAASSDWEATLLVFDSGSPLPSFTSDLEIFATPGFQEIKLDDFTDVTKVQLELKFVGDTATGSTITFGGSSGQSFSAVPEPTSALMFGSLLIAGATLRRRKRLS